MRVNNVPKTDGIIVTKDWEAYMLHIPQTWPRHFRPYCKAVGTMGLDSLVLRSEVSFGHFTTGAKMSGHFRPT